jgi:hypothetical protein
MLAFALCAHTGRAQRGGGIIHVAAFSPTAVLCLGQGPIAAEVPGAPGRQPQKLQARKKPNMLRITKTRFQS